MWEGLVTVYLRQEEQTSPFDLEKQTLLPGAYLDVTPCSWEQKAYRVSCYLMYHSHLHQCITVCANQSVALAC